MGLQRMEHAWGVGSRVGFALVATLLLSCAYSGVRAQIATVSAESTATATPGASTSPGEPAAPAGTTAATPPASNQPFNETGLTTGVATLPPFYALRSCLPFNVLVRVGDNATGNGTLTLVADADVVSAVQVTITNDVLALSIGGNFETNRTIQATVEVPDAASLQYVQNFGVGDVILAPGFNAPRLSVAATGLGGVYVFNSTIQQLSVLASGAATVGVEGGVTDATVRLDGTAKAYLTGNVTGAVNVGLTGISTAFIAGTPGTTITGTADGLSKVLFTDGQCTARTSFQSLFGINVFGDPCNQVSTNTTPTFSPVWTCGLLSQGRSDCSSPTNTELNVPVSNSTGATAAQATPPPAPAPTSSAPGTTTVTGPGGTVTTSTFTSGPGASANAGGLVGSSGLPPLGLFQQSIGGAAPVVSVLPSTAATQSSPFTQTSAGNGGSSSSVSSSGTASSSSGPGNARSALVDVSIPDTSSGLAAVGLNCEDAYPTLMLPAQGAEAPAQGA